MSQQIEAHDVVAPNGERRRLESAAERWERMPVIVTGEDYVRSLRGRGTTLYLFGERIEEPADHPIIQPSINAASKSMTEVAATMA